MRHMPSRARPSETRAAVGGARSRRNGNAAAAASVIGLLALAACGDGGPMPPAAANENATDKALAVRGQDRAVNQNVNSMLGEGRTTFRFDTFGDEAFWGDALKLHLAIEGAGLGGVGAGVSPKAALDLGLKVDADALDSAGLLGALKSGTIDLNAPASTLALLKANAVLGLTGFFNGDGTLKSIGIQCALCHSTVDNSLAFGIGHRLDGFANRDLDVGKIAAAAPDLSSVATLLGLDQARVRAIFSSWGPGKFDAELFLDGKAFNPRQTSNGVVTGTNISGATLIPNAFGLAGFNQHTWTGAWGSVPYWNAFVATLEMHGKGRFFDPRLNDAAQFPIAAANGFADLPHIGPDEDRVSAKLPALHFYQLALPAPAPRPDIDFNVAAAKRGDELFSNKARCNACHVDPLWTEPGWNLHKPGEVGIDSFQADRAPDHSYKTMNLAGIFVRENGLYMQAANKGRYYHDGRFKTLLDVVDHYNGLLGLGLSEAEKSDLIEYLKSLPEAK